MTIMLTKTEYILLIVDFYNKHELDFEAKELVINSLKEAKANFRKRGDKISLKWRQERICKHKRGHIIVQEGLDFIKVCKICKKKIKEAEVGK